MYHFIFFYKCIIIFYICTCKFSFWKKKYRLPLFMSMYLLYHYAFTFLLHTTRGQGIGSYATYGCSSL
uniref:Uncharacterized protein n=1 Tax=Rhizophora mucronata TaxID=61149 RepID=A0A2P2MES4_RHIMU